MNKDLMIIIVDDELEALTHFLYQVVEKKIFVINFLIQILLKQLIM